MACRFRSFQVVLVDDFLLVAVEHRSLGNQYVDTLRCDVFFERRQQSFPQIAVLPEIARMQNPFAIGLDEKHIGVGCRVTDEIGRNPNIFSDPYTTGGFVGLESLEGCQIGLSSLFLARNMRQVFQPDAHYGFG